MTEAPPTRPRRKLWPVALVITTLLALTTWDVLRNIGGSHGEALRRAAYDGDETTVRRIVAAHPEVIDSVNRSAAVIQRLREAAVRYGGSDFAPTDWPDLSSFESLEVCKPTALFLAVLRTNLGTAKFLTESGADVNVRPKGYYPVAFTAMMATGDTNFLGLLAKRGARLDIQDPEFGMTLFHLAAYQPQNPEMHRFLLDNRVPVNARSHDGKTALDWAVSWDRPVLLQFLLENGADWTLADGQGRTPLSRARKTAGLAFKTNAPAILAMLEGYDATNKPPAKSAP